MVMMAILVVTECNNATIQCNNDVAPDKTEILSGLGLIRQPVWQRESLQQQIGLGASESCRSRALRVEIQTLEILRISCRCFICRWKFKLWNFFQIPCWSRHMARQQCRQYLTGTAGTVQVVTRFVLHFLASGFDQAFVILMLCLSQWKRFRL